jgi:alpha-beta hydrolase superfamily lysophospholipase
MIRRRGLVSTLGAAAMLLGLRPAYGNAQAPLAPLAPPLPAVPPAPGFPVPDQVFTMRDGFTLPARLWHPPAGTPVRGVILALHGFTDSRDGWEIPAPGFTAAGYTMVAPDLRGFGATADRGSWAGQQVMVDDAAELARRLRAQFPGQRLVVMGESMGGAIAMCLAARAPGAADDFVLLSPAVWGPGQMAFSLRAALWTAYQVAPGWQLTGREVPLEIAASDNYDALLRMARDPLTLRGATVAMLRGLVDLMGCAQQAAPRQPANVLILNGRRDQVVPPEATAAAWAKLPPPVRRGLYLNGYHLLLRDLDRALVEADILSWLDDPQAWLPSGADVNASAWAADNAWAGDVSAALPAQALDGAGERRVWPF